MSTDTQRPFLSVVIPVYNESERISDPLGRVSAHLAKQTYTSEMVVVDDGSRDSTFEVLRESAKAVSVPVRVIRYQRNRGKGCALKVGFNAARGERILFTDADLSTPIESADALLSKIEDGADVAIGSRRMKGAMIKVHQPWYREGMGKVFTYIVGRLFADVSDVTCGFKAFRGDVGRDLFSRVRVYDWSFDAEILLVAKRMGYRLEEVPVEWEDREGTKVNLLRDAVISMVGLLRIRMNDLAGRYRCPQEIDFSTEVWNARFDAVAQGGSGVASRSTS